MAKTHMALREPAEIELKLLLSAHALAVLDRHPALQRPSASAPRTRLEHTDYFDTPDLSLARQGLSLRVRRHGKDRVQTLKSTEGGQTVAAVRGEWQWPIKQDIPDISLLAETPFGTRIATLELQPVFATDIRRKVSNVNLVGDSIVELSIDVGRVFAGEATQDVSEFELELKRGAPGPLYRLALDLHATIPFIIGVESKAQRGQKLLTGKAAVAVKSRAVALDGNSPASEAVRGIIAAELGHLLANQPAASAGDVEGLHQMRGGIRRLRTVLALFGKQLEPQAAQRFKTGLKRLGQVLGKARDWDVFCTQLLPDASRGHIVQSWLESLRSAAEAARRAAHCEMKEEFARPGMTGLVLGMAAWLEPDDAGSTVPGDDALHRPMRKLARILLNRMARRVAKHGRHLRRRPIEQLHRLRKALKKLGDSADFLAALYPSKAVQRFQKLCRHLMALLGEANDAAMATGLAKNLCTDGSGELTPAVALLARWSDRRRDKALAKLPKAWAKFSAATPFWS